MMNSSLLNLLKSRRENDLFLVFLCLVLRITNWGKWSDIEQIRLPANEMLSRLFENMLSIRVLECEVIRVGRVEVRRVV